MHIITWRVETIILFFAERYAYNVHMVFVVRCSYETTYTCSRHGNRLKHIISFSHT